MSMPSIDFWRRMVRLAGLKPRPTPGRDAHDELMFHFRALVDDKLAEGLSFDVAWERAEQQFGPMRLYENECRAIQSKQGLAWRLAGALGVALALTCAGWSEIRGARLREGLRLLRQDFETVRRESSQLMVQSGVPGDERRARVDLTGVILGADGQPLPDATVLVILKTWPEGQYRQDDFTATTSAQGRFNLPGLVPADGRYAIQVAAVKDGFAFHSAYQLKQTGRLDPIALRLERASIVTLVVRDGNGEPVPNARVIPSARESRRGENHLIYFQGSEPVQKTTDAEGRVRLNCFLAGDLAEVHLRLPGNDWDSRNFEVSAADSVVEVATSRVNAK